VICARSGSRKYSRQQPPRRHGYGHRYIAHRGLVESHVHQFLARIGWRITRRFRFVGGAPADGTFEYVVEDPNRDTDRFVITCSVPKGITSIHVTRRPISLRVQSVLSRDAGDRAFGRKLGRRRVRVVRSDPFAELGQALFLARGRRNAISVVVHHGRHCRLAVRRLVDLPYEQLMPAFVAPGSRVASLHAERQQPQNNPRAARIAQAVSKRFSVTMICASRRPRRAAASDRKGDGCRENWIVVQGRLVREWAAAGKQGFPSKVKAYLDQGARRHPKPVKSRRKKRPSRIRVKSDDRCAGKKNGYEP